MRKSPINNKPKVKKKRSREGSREESPSAADELSAVKNKAASRAQNEQPKSKARHSTAQINMEQVQNEDKAAPQEPVELQGPGRDTLRRMEAPVSTIDFGSKIAPAPRDTKNYSQVKGKEDIMPQAQSLQYNDPDPDFNLGLALYGRGSSYIKPHQPVIVSDAKAYKKSSRKYENQNAATPHDQKDKEDSKEVTDKALKIELEDGDIGGHPEEGAGQEVAAGKVLSTKLSQGKEFTASPEQPGEVEDVAVAEAPEDAKVVASKAKTKSVRETNVKTETDQNKAEKIYGKNAAEVLEMTDITPSEEIGDVGRELQEVRNSIRRATAKAPTIEDVLQAGVKFAKDEKNSKSKAKSTGKLPAGSEAVQKLDPEKVKCAEMIEKWLEQLPNPESMKKADERILRLQDIATRINKKYAQGEFQCRIDFNANKPGRNSIKRPSTYPFEQEKSGRKVILSDYVFESLDLIFEDSLGHVIDNQLDLTDANFSRNMMEDIEHIHAFEKGTEADVLTSNKERSAMARSRIASSRMSTGRSSEMTNAGGSGIDGIGGSYCSNTTTEQNQATGKEKERLKAIFNFVRIQIKHSRMLDLAHFLCHCCTSEFSHIKFWDQFLGKIELQSNFYRTWSLILLERLQEFCFACENQACQLGDLVITLTKSSLYKEIILDSFGMCDATPGEAMENFLDRLFPSPGNPPTKDCLDQSKMVCCPTYQLFLVQYLCHCVYLQRLAILSLPYQILDLLTFSLRTTDQELVNLQEALNESLVCLSIANFAHSSQSSRKAFFDLYAPDKIYPVRLLTYVIKETSTKRFLLLTLF